jgi:hypothetical protein
MPEDRRLAAIMPARPEWNGGGFTDIVGYTTLMGSDEDKAERYAMCDGRCAMYDFFG